jgi:anti-sigma B factor antagonist
LGTAFPYAEFMTRAGDSGRFRIEASRQGEARVLRLIGELDLSGVDLFEKTLEAELDAERGLGLVALDLRDLSFMDSSGLRALVMADRRVRDAGRSLVVVRPSGSVERVMTLTDVSERLELVDDVPTSSG